MYRLSFSILLSVFCFGFSVYAKTLENPPNAYLIDHRGIPHFDENDVMQSASYSDLQTAGLSTDHLQIHPDGDEFYWEIPTEDISTDDYAITGAASNPVVSSLTVSGSELTLTLSGAVAQGEMVELSYTKSKNAGSIVDCSGNRLEDFSKVEVNFVTFNLNKSKETEIFFTNPVRDYLEIRSESVVKGIALYSLTGQRVFERKPNVTALSLDISSLAQGIYLMKVKTTTHQTTLKLVKQ